MRRTLYRSGRLQRAVAITAIGLGLGVSGTAAETASAGYDVHLRINGAGEVQEGNKICRSFGAGGANCNWSYGTHFDPFRIGFGARDTTATWRFTGWSGCPIPVGGWCSVDLPGRWGAGSLDLAANFGQTDVRIAGGPGEGAVVASPTAFFTFGPAGPTVGPFRYRCSIDGRSWENCDAASIGYSLAEGWHTFRVEGYDAWGWIGADARAWKIDVTPPGMAITAAPRDPTSSRMAAFTFVSDDATSVECALDGRWRPCAGSASYDGLGDGRHRFAVRGRDAVGNERVVEHAWHVDTALPATRVRRGPAALTSATEATFEFEASEPARFECGLDDRPATRCASGWTVAGLSAGQHVVVIRATDEAGNEEASPPEIRWRVTNDLDADGSLMGQDCDDADPARHPGATDKPRNGVDEDCDDVDADFARIQADIRHAERGRHGRTLVRKLTVSGFPADATVRLTCRGDGCRMRAKTLNARPGVSRIVLAAHLRRSRLGKGATVEVRVTAPNVYGKLLRLRMRRGKAPRTEWLKMDPVTRRVTSW